MYTDVVLCTVCKRVLTLGWQLTVGVFSNSTLLLGTESLTECDRAQQTYLALARESWESRYELQRSCHIGDRDLNEIFILHRLHHLSVDRLPSMCNALGSIPQYH